MKIDLIEQWIKSQSKSAYDIKSRQAWVKAMRIAGLDEQTIMRVYEIRFEKQFVEVRAMSFYIIEDDNGNVLTNYGDFDNTMIYAMLYYEPLEPERDADEYGGYVVELVEKPKPVEVTQEEAETIEGVKEGWASIKNLFQKVDVEEVDRLTRAYVNGYTVAKEKKYNVKVPHAVKCYFKKIDANYCIAGDTFYVDLDEDLAQFTEAEIEHYGLQDCEKEEVTDDDE